MCVLIKLNVTFSGLHVELGSCWRPPHHSSSWESYCSVALLFTHRWSTGPLWTLYWSVCSRLMFQWRVFTTVKWNILFPQGVCLALVVPSGSQSWTIITLGKICLSGFGSALRVPKVNTHHPRGKNLWLKSMIPFFETKNVLHALYWGFNKIPI